MKHEHVHLMNWKEWAVIVAVSLLASLLIYESYVRVELSWSLIISLVILMAGITIIAYLIPGFGRTISFMALTSLLTFSINDLGVIKIEKVIVLVIAGLLFEIIFMFLKIKIHNLSLDIITGNSLTMAAIPLLCGLVLSPRLALSFPLGLINLILIGFAIGLGGSVFLSLLWTEIESTELVMGLQLWIKR